MLALLDDSLECGEVSSLIFLSFAKGAFRTPQKSYQVLPGDSFRTTCYYKDGVKFGIGAEDEMCIAFILYYPARDLLGVPWICPHGAPDDGSGCATELQQGDLDSVDELGRIFGASSGVCLALTSSTAGSGSTTAAPVGSSTDPDTSSDNTTSPSDAARSDVSFVFYAVSIFVVAIFM